MTTLEIGIKDLKDKVENKEEKDKETFERMNARMQRFEEEMNRSKNLRLKSDKLKNTLENQDLGVQPPGIMGEKK